MDDLKKLRKKILELEQNNLLFKEMEKIGEIGGWQIEPATKKQVWTDEVFRILEIDLEQGAPKLPKGLEFIDPEFRPIAEKAIHDAMENGVPYNQEWIVTTAKGNKKWVNAVCNPILEKEKIIRISGSFQDITERKNAEEELKKTEDRVRLVLDNNPFPIAVVDEKDQNIRFWSKSAIQLFGHNPKTTEEWYELAYPNPEYRKDVIERWKPFVELAQSSKKVINTGEYEIHCKNGNVKICELYAQFIPGNLIVTLSDITEKKNAEEQLKALNQQLHASEQQLRAGNRQLQATNQQLLANEQQLKAEHETHKRTEKIAHVGSWDWDIASDTVTWSDELFQIFRLNPEKGEVSYAEHPKIYTPESMQLLDAAVQHTLETGDPYKMDLEIIRGDGTNAFCTVRGLAKKDENGKVIQLFGSFQDITERKNAEEQLKALYQQLQASEQQFKAANQQLQANEQQLKATNQQLQASEQQLRATNQQLQASEQQLRGANQQLNATNQQLQASEQQLRATNQQLEASEKELRESKETAERYLNISSEIVLKLDTKGNILMLNDSGYQLLGYEGGSLIEEKWFSCCLPKEEENTVRSVFEQIMRGEIENVVNFESDIITKTGEIKTILWHNTVLKDKNGKIIGTLSSGENITERVKTAKELAASEAFLKAIFDKSINAILVADDAGNYITANESAANLFGYPIDQLKKMNVSKLIKTDNPDAEEKYKQYVKEGKESGEIEFTVPNSEKKVAHYNAIRIKKDFNLSVMHDITEDKKAEQKLKNSELKFQNIAKNVPGLVLRYQLFPDGSDKLLFISKSVEDIYEISRQEAVSNVQLLWNMIHPDDLEDYKKSIEEATKNLSSWKREHRILLPDGRVKWLQGFAVPAKQADGSIIFDTLGVDITERKIIEKELIKAKEKAEENENKYKKLIETASDAIYLASEDGTLIETNQGAIDMLGKAKDEIIGYSISDIDPNYPVKEFFDFWENVPFDKQLIFESTHQHKNGNLIPVEISAKKYQQDGKTYYYSLARDITDRKQAEEELKKIEWLLQTKKDKPDLKIPPYGDLTNINQDRTILDSVGKDVLHGIVSDYLNLLETSAAVYEKNGDYAVGIFSSDWCQFMDCSSRSLCNSKDNKKALESGKWLCHESCWNDASLQSIQTNKAVDIECSGGLHIYSIPIKANNEVIGAINFGYGNPPTDEYILSELAANYDVTVKELKDLANSYESRPAFIIDIAKEKLEYSAKLIGNIVERKQIEIELIKAKDKAEESEEKLIEAQKLSHIGSWEYITDTDTVAWSKELYNIFERSHDLPAPKFSLQRPYYSEESFALLSKAVEDCVEREIPYEIELDIITPSGSIKTIISKGDVLKDKNNNIIGSYGTAQDITQKKKIEQEIIKAKEKENRYAEMILSSQSVANICSYSTNLNKEDLDKSTWECSPEFYKIFGIDETYPHTIAGWAAFIHPDFREELVAYHESVVKNRGSFNKEYKIIRINDGAERWVLGTGELMYDEHRNPIRMYGAIQDITERKELEQEIIKAKEKAEETTLDLQLAQKIANIGNWQYDPAIGVPVWSDYIYEIYERNPALGPPHIDEYKKLYKPDQYQIFNKAFQNAIDNGTPYNIKLKLELLNHKTKWLHTICKPDKTKTSHGHFLRGTIQDITQEMQSEMELKNAKEKAEISEEKFKLLNYLTSEMLLLQDLNSIYKFIPENLQKLYPHTIVLMVSIDESNQLTKLEFVSGLDNSLLSKVIKISGFNPIGKTYKLTAFQKNYLKSSNFVEFEGGLAEFSSSEFPAFAATAIEKIMGLNKIYTVGINKDDELFASIHFFTFNKQVITDGNFIEVFVKQAGLVLQKKIDEKTLNFAKDKAEESDRLKSAFLANMSHEIRTPMNGILGFTNLLQEPNLSGEEHKEYIDIIQKSGNRMLNTVNDIIDISRIESGQVEFSDSEVNINKQLEYLHSFFNPEAEKKGIELIFKNVKSEQDALFVTDLDKFNSILTNLIKNAIKFTNHGSIEIGYNINKKNDVAELTFYVKDSGIGIPKDRQEAIFHRFVQADIEDKNAQQGSGLGLAISKAYTEMLGGTMWVDSKEGKGSTFYFTIECSFVDKSKPVAINDSEIVEEEKSIKNLKILVVEDDATSKRLVTLMLKKFAKALLTASSGFEAVDICLKNPDIDLIILDIQLPGMNGYEATRQIRQFNKDVIVLAQTAYALAGDRDKAIEAGCNDYIAKPIEKKELQKMVKKYFGG